MEMERKVTEFSLDIKELILVMTPKSSLPETYKVQIPCSLDDASHAAFTILGNQ